MTCPSIRDWFEAVSIRHGMDKALTFYRNGRVETVFTYSELAAEVHRFACFLTGYHLEKGDRVVLLLNKSVVAVVAHFALQKWGVVSVPLNPDFKRKELEYLVNDAGPRMIVTEPEQTGLIRRIDQKVPLLEISTQKPYQELELFGSGDSPPPDRKILPEDPGLMIYTSGTTGHPKGAVLTQGNLVHDADNIINIWKMTRQDVLCHALPLFHIHGLCFALHTALLSGSHTLLFDRFTPDSILATLSGNKRDAVCSIFMAVPAMYARLLDTLGDRQIDFSHIRLLTSGSAPLPEKTFWRIRKTFGIEPVEREGMSETGMNFSNPLSGVRKPGSIGLPLPGVTVRIIDLETGLDVRPGQIGEIWLKSAAITPGYWRKSAETRAAFDNGWFKTGDLGKIDSDGYYYLTDRIKHIIITGGENVSAKEVERVINGFKGVIESTVVGIPDEKWGERVAAAVTVEADADLKRSDILSVCRENLHAWKCPKEIVFVNEIPRNTMGKVLKNVVKKNMCTGG